MKNRIVLLLLSLLGLPGCDKESPDAYGCPYSTYRIGGRVPDTAGTPNHNNIRTDAVGTYLLTGRDLWSADSLRFSDTDGEANGGRFVRRAVGIDWQKAGQTGKGDGGWYRGEYSLTVDAELEKEPDDRTS